MFVLKGTYTVSGSVFCLFVSVAHTKRMLVCCIYKQFFDVRSTSIPVLIENCSQ